jgi:hypothetical protein
MTSNDPITAIVDQLAAHAEQLTRLDARHADHHAAVSARLAELTGQAAALGHVVEEHAAALARLTAPSQPGPDGDGYCPEPAPAWWKLAADGRQEPLARLRAWVEQVYWPSYGHLAAGLGLCWPAHDLCLYVLDIAPELWSVLYLQPARSPALLSAQAEYQARILPALADQLRIETRTCGQLREAGLLDGARAYVRTPSGGLHAYFAGTGQRNGHLPAHHLDFRSRGGYVLTPPSQIGGKPYELVQALHGHGALDWDAVTRHLQPQRQAPPRHPQPGRQDLSALARWVASQSEGNRNAGLFWAANRALDADPAADLSPWPPPPATPT